MTARIHWKIVHPAATSSMLKIKSLPYHDTAAGFRRPTCVDAIPFEACGDCTLAAIGKVILDADQATRTGTRLFLIKAWSTRSRHHGNSGIEGRSVR
jgi:hypothetical protein